MKLYLPLLIAIFFSVSLTSNAQIPVAYYPFNGNANDAIGSLNGTVNGAILTMDRFGNANSAYNFDGINDFISTSGLATNKKDNWTMIAWIKPAAASQVQTSIVMNGFDNGLTGNGYALSMGNTSPNQVAGFLGGVVYLNSGSLFQNGNVWYQVVMVREAGITKFYLNGVQSSTTNSSEPNTPSGTLRIGSSDGLRFFNGDIDEVKIYNTALSATQVVDEYNSSLQLTANYTTDFGNCVRMNGKDDNIDLGTSYTQQTFTVEMWLKPDATQTLFADIIDNNHNGGRSWVCQLSGANINMYNFSIINTGASVTFKLKSNDWQHLALVKGANFIEVYVNGVLVGSATSTGALTYSDQFLRLGRWGGGGRNWNGSMDEVRIWNTVRTQAEIMSNMNAQLIGNEPGLVSYFDMNRQGKGAGLTVENKATATGSALNGITVGTAITPVFVPGTIPQKPGSGNAISFDGVDDHITTDSKLVPTSGDFTVDFWVNSRSSSGGFKEFISQGASGDAFYIGTENNGTIRCGDTWQVTSVVLPINKWVHLAITKSGTDGTLYINGIEVGNQANYSISAGGTNTLIGRQYGGLTEYPDASIDEVRIWNTALTQTQIRDRMCHKITSSDALYNNLVTYFNFDESGGNTLFDGTDNANIGTLTNSPSRVISGAAIGNASSHDYINTTKITNITHATGETFSVTSKTGNPDGIQLYLVNESPNNLVGAAGVGSNNKYFGVFQVGGSSPTYQAEYNYTGNSNVNMGNEGKLDLYKRTNNAETSWITSGATLNKTNKTLTLSGESTEYILGSTKNPLPLTLLSFSGSKENNNAQLHWQTLNELNVNHFEIERSDDGKNFVTVGKVLAGLESYSFADVAIFSTKSMVFYRLKSVVKNESFTYSGIIRLNSQLLNQLVLYPNPVKDQLTISGLKEKSTIRLYGPDGKLLQQKRMISKTKTITIDMKRYAKGMYLLQYDQEGEIISQKIIKD